METVIYFIRHAQSLPKAYIDRSNWFDCPLSELGENQARNLSDIIFNLNVEHVISSPYIRCINTIKPFIDTYKIPMTIHNDLREKYISHSFIEESYEIWVKSWEDFHFKIPGCESSFEAQDRFVKSVKDISFMHQGKTIAVITHGDVLGLFLNYIDSLNHMEKAEKMRNPDILRVVHRESRFLWDRDFRAQGLDNIATHRDQIPLDNWINRDSGRHPK
jgi:2,3-bisphosphoglycerate-dependent phosphoglycerate mutase